MDRTRLQRAQDDPIFQALDPRGKKFMEVRWLPERLNPLCAENNMRVAALVPFTLFPHVKSIPAWQMLYEDCAEGRYTGKHTIVVDSSGNTAHAVARLAPAFGFREVKVVVPSDIPESKKGILAALSSVEIIEVGGGKSVSGRAREEVKKSGHIHLNQYAHPGNWRAHELYMGPEIGRVLGGFSLKFLGIALGSAGTAYGVGRYFKKLGHGVSVIGVRPNEGEQVPGTRDKERMEAVVRFPWRTRVDATEEVSRKESFVAMRQLWSAVEPQPGPSSGLAWAGLRRFVGRLRRKSFTDLWGTTIAFLCPDDGRFYSERTTGELDPDQGVR